MHPLGRTWISDSLLSVADGSHLGTTQPIGHTQTALPWCATDRLLSVVSRPNIDSDDIRLIFDLAKYGGGVIEYELSTKMAGFIVFLDRLSSYCSSKLLIKQRSFSIVSFIFCFYLVSFK